MELFLHLPDLHSKTFFYKAPWLWNCFCQIIDLGKFGLHSDENLVKNLLRISLLEGQNMYNLDNWTNENFIEFGPTKLTSSCDS